MAGMGQPVVERLREFLRSLKPGARALLIAELERSILRGDDSTGSDLILTELRRSFRGGGIEASRIGDHARLFFQPLEPFLVDEALDHKHRGRLARSTLEPIWLWLSNTVMPEEARAYGEAVETALLESDAARAKALADAFQGQAVERLQIALDRLAKDDKAERQLCVQLGTTWALEDVQTVVGVLRAREALATLGTQLPGHIKSLAGPPLEAVKAQIDAAASANADVILYALVLLIDRLAASWQLIRLATKAAGADSGARAAVTPYGVAVTVVLAELERLVRELAADLKSGRGIAVVAMLRDIHDAVRGLRSEIDLPADSAWGKQLTTIRSDLSKLLSAEIELVGGRMRRLLRLRPAKEIVPNSTVDADEVNEVEILIGFVVACRSYVGEFAISEVTQRAVADAQQYLDTGTRGLIDALRAAGDADRAFRRSQLDAAVRFCGKVFGKEYAALLAKSAEVAAQDNGERKAFARG